MANFCHYFSSGICNSCDFIEVEYSHQIAEKERRLRKLLDLNSSQLLPSVQSPLNHFRNRAKLSVTGTSAQPILGLLGNANDKEGLDEGREILNCPVHHLEINAHLHALKDFIKRARLEPYQIASQRGELKSLILFYSEKTSALYIRFVLRSQEPVSRILKFLPDFLSQNPCVKNVSVNLQPIPHAILEGPTEINLYGAGFIDHDLEGNPGIPLLTQLSPRAFVQTNSNVAGKLYQTAARWINELKVEKMLELFCGQGAFSLSAAPVISSALGVEINAEAVKTANQTAKTLAYTHLKFVAKDASEVQSSIDDFKPDLILVNPPRRGLGKSLSLFQSARAPYLIYSSCNVESLAQDLLALPNYEIIQTQIFDLFAHTHHFEVLVLLKRKAESEIRSHCGVQSTDSSN